MRNITSSATLSLFFPLLTPFSLTFFFSFNLLFESISQARRDLFGQPDDLHLKLKFSSCRMNDYTRAVALNLRNSGASRDF